MPYKSCEEEELEDIKERENIDLITGLLSYTKSLEEMVIELRSKINALTPSGEQLPFPDLHGDVYEVFDHYPSYERYRECIEIASTFSF